MTRNNPQDNPALLELKALLIEPETDLAKFYKKHSDLVLQITAAALYLTAAALMLFASTAFVAIALGLTIGAAFVSFGAAVTDFYRYRKKHSFMVDKIKHALKSIPPGDDLNGFDNKLKKHQNLFSKWSLLIPYPWLSLGLNVIGGGTLIVIAALNFAAVLSTTALASPHVLVAWLVLNLLMMIFKDLVINKTIKANNKHLKNLCNELVIYLSNERLDLIEPKIPSHLQSYVKSEISELREAINNDPFPPPPVEAAPVAEMPAEPEAGIQALPHR